MHLRGGDRTLSWQAVMDDPMLAGMVVATLGAIAAGCGLMWKALVGAVVRALDQLAPGHKGDEQELIRKVRQHSGQGRVENLMTTIAPGFAIERQMKIRASMVPSPPTARLGDDE